MDTCINVLIMIQVEPVRCDRKLGHDFASRLQVTLHISTKVVNTEICSQSCQIVQDSTVPGYPEVAHG